MEPETGKWRLEMGRWRRKSAALTKHPSPMKNKVPRFEDLEVWKESMRLAVQIDQTTVGWRDDSLRDQMQRAAVSIPSNIAEGYERGANREFVQFLNYAKGSSGELRTQIYLATKLSRIDGEVSRQLLEKSRKVSAMLHRYIQVRKRDF
jgi:four helix bundle protein